MKQIPVVGAEMKNTTALVDWLLDTAAYADTPNGTIEGWRLVDGLRDAAAVIKELEEIKRTEWRTNDCRHY